MKPTGAVTAAELSKYLNKGGWKYYFVWNNGTIDSVKYYQGLFHITIPRKCGWMFTNYFHAYAHQLKLRKDHG